MASDLRKLGWTPTRYNSDFWYRNAGDHYEYLAVYVDNVIIFSKRAEEVMNDIMKIYPMKGVSKPEFYLGGSIGYLENGKRKILFNGARKYIEGITKKLENLLDQK